MNKTAWECLEMIRNKSHLTIRDYIPLIFDKFYELHGDRLYGDDGAIIGGIAEIGGMPVTVIAEVKGRNIEENKKAISQCLTPKATERPSDLPTRRRNSTVPLSAS